MSNVIPICYSKKKELTLKIKRRNNDIIYDLYQEGKVKHNPYAHAHESEYFEGDVIEVPAICFEMKRAYKVGI